MPPLAERCRCGGDLGSGVARSRREAEARLELVLVPARRVPLRPARPGGGWGLGFCAGSWSDPSGVLGACGPRGGEGTAGGGRRTEGGLCSPERQVCQGVPAASCGLRRCFLWRPLGSGSVKECDKSRCHTPARVTHRRGSRAPPSLGEGRAAALWCQPHWDRGRRSAACAGISGRPCAPRRRRVSPASGGNARDSELAGKRPWPEGDRGRKETVAPEEEEGGLADAFPRRLPPSRSGKSLCLHLHPEWVSRVQTKRLTSFPETVVSSHFLQHVNVCTDRILTRGVRTSALKNHNSTSL